MDQRAAQVAVIVPAYNASGFIVEALDSLVAQTYDDWIGVVADDGSSDADQLRHVVRPYSERVLYLPLPHAGAAAARNAAMRAVDSEFVAFLDADDQWLPTFLESQVTFLKAHSEFALVYADGYLLGPTISGGRLYSETSPSTGSVTFRSLVMGKCNVLTSSVVARRGAIEAVGGFDPDLPRAHDFDLWIRLVRSSAGIGYRRVPLVRYRVHTGGISGNAMQVFERDIMVLRHIDSTFDLDQRERWELRRALKRADSFRALELAKESLRRLEISDVRHHLLAAMRLHATMKTALALSASWLSPGLLRRLFLKISGQRAQKPGRVQS
jgi:glycosyltransferase involved in cell wall biosynthesis